MVYILSPSNTVDWLDPGCECGLLLLLKAKIMRMFEPKEKCYNPC